MAQRFGTLLRGTPELRPLLSRVQAVSNLQRHFESVVPPALAAYARALELRSGVLGIAAANASIAAKLRQLAPELVVLLRDRGCEVSGIRVTVQVAHTQAKPRASARSLSAPAGAALASLCDDLEDSPLKRALRKLAAHRK